MNLIPTELGNLPFATLTAGMLWQLLGPSAKYLGGKTQELTQKSVENLERVFAEALRRLPDDAKADGVVPPRVLRLAVSEGSFTEDSIAAAYLGGVLASSKTETGRDDRGVCINSLISRLSVFQLRLHYVSYMAMHYLLQGTDSDFGAGGELRNALHFGTNGLLIAMGFGDDGLNDPDFNLDSALTHALYGLSKEELIGEWEFDWKAGLTCTPTPIGTELFLWANGQGRQSIEYFFDRKFEPIQPDEESISIVPGRKYEAELDDGEVVIVNGFDYATPHSNFHRCKIT